MSVSEPLKSKFVHGRICSIVLALNDVASGAVAVVTEHGDS